ncbi:MAG TPA: tetratricopeptide repeat protein [Humisphaera sp.]|nr:tetratricopeptide repeat protein [Humisphaera sp.]
MPETTCEDPMDAALREHQAGNFAEAEALYRRVLEHDHRNPDAMHLLGVLALQVGKPDAALTLIKRAISIKPAAAFFGNLGLVHAAQGKFDLAIDAYRQAIEIRPDFPEAHNNLGGALRQTRQLDAAIAAYEQAIAFRPGFAEAHNNLGLALTDTGRNDEAIVHFRKAVAIVPNYAQARNNLGNAFHRQGDLQTAIACWREALSLCPDLAEAHNNLGNAFKETGRLDEAVEAFNRALSLDPNLPEALNNLGVILHGKGQAVQAIEIYQRAIALRPDYAEAHYNLAIAFHSVGVIAPAITACQRAVSLRPGWAQACNNLGNWLSETGRPDDALAALDRALDADPTYPEAHSNRGNVLRRLGRLDEASTSYRHAIALRNDYAEAHNNLGDLLRQTGRLSEAAASFRNATELQPHLPAPHGNLGNVLKDQGDLDGAIACFSRATDLDSTDAAMDSNRIYTLYFHPDCDPARILNEHRLWNDRHARRFKAEIPRHDNAPFPRRRLKIGYVSPDFRDHCQAMFTLPLFSNHDRDRFEIHCYSDVVSPDATTDRLRTLADVWRNIAGMPDAQVAELIRRDKIDILVDLTVHMANHRLLVFARKSAPVQVTWLGYPGTTGLETMDYRLSDPYLDPPSNDRSYTEQTIRLPETFWCYDPLTIGLEPNPLPAIDNGHITFGCLNNFCKINDATLRLWARVMQSTEKSRLLLLAPDGDARARVLDVLREAGIESPRVDFVGRQSRRRYLETFHRIDVCLDTFPYNGHTTSLDSFWMGVPVVTKTGVAAVSRGGWSQLSNLGLTELADDRDDWFVRVAANLAADVDRLRKLRSTLRGRMTASPLMNAPRFARNIESAYRSMWESWSTRPAPTASRPGVRVSIHASVKRSANPKRMWMNAETPRR